MFVLSKVIPNENAPSNISEVSFHPDQDLFAVTFQYNDEVRIFDARSFEVCRVFRNPEAALNKPHGVLLTRKHLIVANKGEYPSKLRVFRLDDPSGTPMHSYTTPFAHLAEGHSMALRDRRLVVTYCEGQGKMGAIVSYDFDDETGQISGPLDIQEQWFSAYGDAKGVCFDAKGERVFVTFQSDIMPWRLKLTRRLKNAFSFGTRGGPSRNGMAVFGIDQRGGLTRRPLWKKVERRFCRLENIHIVGDCGIITNSDNASIEVYDVRRDPGFRKPVQVITDPLCFPHGAKLSPDASTLVVTDNGIRIVNHVPQWGDFLPTRKDRVLVYKLQDPAALVPA